MTTLFAKHILSIPTISGKEDFFIDCIKKWCKITGISVSQDGKGNLYLQKGEAEWMPCLCSHLDTVHKKYAPYIAKKELLPVQIDGDRLYIDGMGVGADCKSGVAICLSVMRKSSCCKCVLFVEEEIGMVGSKSLDVSFFDNVSYVLSWDSPGGNRATKTSAGVPMFTDELFEIIKPIYSSHGVTNWKHEPYTDTVQIVKKTGTCCINAKNGGSMMCHTDKEDASISEMNDSEQLCLDAIAGIPCDRKWKIEYKEPPKPKYGGYFTSPYLASPSYSASPYQSSSYYSRYSHAPHQEEVKKPAAPAPLPYSSSSSSNDLTLADIERHSSTDMCEFTFTYDDEEQYESHMKALEKEDIVIEMDDFDPLTTTATGSTELAEMKLAYILWYQLFYDRPDIKTWAQVKADDDLTDFADGLVFLEDSDEDYIDF